MRGIFVRDKEPSAAIAALLGALGTKYPCEKTRIDNAPELCGITLEESRDDAMSVHVDALGGGYFGEARHGKYGAG